MRACQCSSAIVDCEPTPRPQAAAMENANPFEVLGFAKLSAQELSRLRTEDIQQAYKARILLHHPDKGGSNDTFHELQIARKQLCGKLQLAQCD